MFYKTSVSQKNQINTRKKDSYTKFNMLFFTITFIPLIATGVFNMIIDPYGITKTPTFVGLNLLKPAQDNQTRLFKSAEIISIKPKRLILGSSTVILGIAPKNTELINNKEKDFYNLGLTGSYISEVHDYLKHALLNQPKVEEIILGLDFFMFNKTKKEINFDRQDFLNQTQIPLSEKLAIDLSLNTLEKSIDTIEDNLRTRQTKPYYSLGMRNNINLEQLNKTSNTSLLFKHQIQNYLTNYYKNYQLSQTDLQKLKDIVTICQKNNITLTVFISPLHASQMEAIKQAGLWTLFEQWKQEIAQITPVWDFSSYNSITEEPIQNKMKYFHDSVHYSKETGDLILSRIFSNSSNNVPSNFGKKLLANQNYQEYFKTIRENGNQWARINPKIVKAIQDIRKNIQSTNQ
ncbi:hypothetical protein C7H19_09045 [Aphanothece hegewaldii CCALA 016]|uniref:DUF1574 domain-containing protein n=1 Tax=Aphanothece hegewaldii CCALA 016 TaxID=2107694 RepID=A0A2T1LZ55_9CHRO|nr:DUF1574 family protein [Aphanothece hegewaldii]PSF37690.1 hypothetical protein C7H19_09045 [Aphanothece hegewaldii CCALA 016]